MSLNSTPSAERVHIGFFGRRNVGKSSLVNAVTGQEMSIVSKTLGTTTDPVQKSMELLPLGPVVIIDTPGFDDVGELGEKRVQRAERIIARTDVAVLVADCTAGLTAPEQELLELFRKKKIPHVIAWNKCDLCPDAAGAAAGIRVSAKTGEGIHALKETIARIGKAQEKVRPIASDLVPEGGVAVLVIPIDASAPKGRIILPQQQVIRDLLDAGRQAVCTRETELASALAALAEAPALVITDSQAFRTVAEILPESVPLTSFSILMARYKGTLAEQIRGIEAIGQLADGDRVLIAEGCTHHRTCEDIGTVKIPAMLKKRTGRELRLEFTSGTEYPEDLTPYKLVIHCGGCMLNEREMQYRMKCTLDQGVPFTNYGITIAHTQGILRRSLEVFPALLSALDA